jgi:hypothetical protein
MRRRFGCSSSSNEMSATSPIPSPRNRGSKSADDWGVPWRWPLVRRRARTGAQRTLENQRGWGLQGPTRRSLNSTFPALTAMFSILPWKFVLMTEARRPTFPPGASFQPCLSGAAR